MHVKQATDQSQLGDI